MTTLNTFKSTPRYDGVPTSRQQAADLLRLYRARPRFLVSRYGHEYAIGRIDRGPFAVLTTR